jgi:flagellar biosynthetic protein FliQ
MSPQTVLDMMQEAFKIALQLSLPVMLTTLVVGVAISIIQSITSIQEQTMVFVPKIIAVFIAIVICFSWMMASIITFTHDLIVGIPNLLQ